jgi:hypothetical protein
MCILLLKPIFRNVLYQSDLCQIIVIGAFSFSTVNARIFALTSSSIPTIKKHTYTVCKHSIGVKYVSCKGCQERGDIKV